MRSAKGRDYDTISTSGRQSPKPQLKLKLKIHNHSEVTQSISNSTHLQTQKSPLSNRIGSIGSRGARSLAFRSQAITTSAPVQNVQKNSSRASVTLWLCLRVRLRHSGEERSERADGRKAGAVLRVVELPAAKHRQGDEKKAKSSRARL